MCIRKTKIQAVIFDLDGTLAHSALLTMAALRLAAPQFGLPLPAEDTVRRTIGYANPTFYFKLFPDVPRDLTLALGAFVEQEELRLLPSFGHKLLFPGCRDLLLHLNKRGIACHIASTGEVPHVYGILETTGIVGLFDQIACGSPDKFDMLRKLIASQGPHSAIMVGDMKKDYEAAKANGILSIGACYGYCQRARTAFDLYIDSPYELLEMV